MMRSGAHRMILRRRSWSALYALNASERLLVESSGKARDADIPQPMERNYRNVRTASGFTAVELMVSLAIVGILLAIAVPSLSDATLSSQLSSNANRLAASATLARSEAIKRNASVVVCMSADGASCASSGGWEQGWVMLRGATVLSREQAANTGFKLNVSPTNATSLTFDATGVGSTQATFTVCRGSPNVGAQERVVTLSATGRATVSKTSSGTCV